MTRELKFRLWDIQFKRMKTSCMGINKGVLDGDDDTIIMQYTGLKDKYGKEGYQGDWIGGLFDSCYVDWCDKCCQLELFTTQYGCTCCNGDIDWWEVVDSITKGESWFGSNIYENPELL